MNLPGPTPMTSRMGFSPSVGQQAFGYGDWSPPAMQTIHEEHAPELHNFIPGNLWSLNLRNEALEQASSLGFFHKAHQQRGQPKLSSLRHTGQWPVRNLHDLNTFPSIENAMAHQRYLEQLSSETHSLHQWSRIIAERINDEREVAHNSLASILESFSSAHQVNAWTTTASNGPNAAAESDIAGQASTSAQVNRCTI